MKSINESLKLIPKEQTEFLKESNAIEGVYDEASLVQAQCAWVYLLSQREINEHVVKHTHAILMANQNLSEHEKGMFRVVGVWIGGRKGMRFEHIPLAIESWCTNMNVGTEEYRDDLEKTSKMLHVDYEHIHPFVDGNGRTGRMFMNWWRIKNGLPILVIHEGEEQMEYYKWFKDS